MFSNRKKGRKEAVRLNVGTLEFEVSYWQEQRQTSRDVPELVIDQPTQLDYRYTPVKPARESSRALLRRALRRRLVAAASAPWSLLGFPVHGRKVIQ